MTTRCSCYNCGYVEDYQLPAHAKIREYEYNDDPADGPSVGSSYEDDPGQRRPFLCSNCGWDMLVIVFWNKTGDPLEVIRRARG